MYDIVIVGGGPAGTVAALRARELGATVALVERQKLGGTCTNDGVVPTRVLAKVARLMRDSQQFTRYGLSGCDALTVNFGAVMQRARDVIDEVHDKKQLFDHLKAVGVTVYDGIGDARFTGPKTLYAEKIGTIQANQFVLCMGGHARKLPIPGGEHALTSSDLWALQTTPKSVVVVGGGATGCQLGSIFNDFGASVRLLELAPRILMTEDADVSAEMQTHFTSRGILIETGVKSVDRIDKTDDGLVLTYHNPDGEEIQVTVDAVIASIGWPGNTDSLGLGLAGVQTTRSYVQVDDYLRTSAPHIFAAGDITGRSMLVQSANFQARIAVENALLSYSQQAHEQLVPHGGFTDPEYGGVGLTEAQAREHHDVVTATVPYADLDRAVIDDRRVGFCKLVVDRRSNRLLGAHVVGEHAVEIVSTASAAIAGGLTIQQFSGLELAYPTFVSVLGLAARQVSREIGAVHVTPEWRELTEVRAAEWERSTAKRQGNASESS
jgi:pyruvate/2-oxoglutarate dehydrogenase complex dihydrolipoamide dehydrogenase (E3) component